MPIFKVGYVTSLVILTAVQPIRLMDELIFKKRLLSIHIYSRKQHLKSILSDIENDTIPNLGLLCIHSFSPAYLGAEGFRSAQTSLSTGHFVLLS